MKKFKIRKAKFRGRINHLPPLGKNLKEETGEEGEGIVQMMIVNELKTTPDNNAI